MRIPLPPALLRFSLLTLSFLTTLLLFSAPAQALWEDLDEPYPVLETGTYNTVLYDQHIETDHFYIEFTNDFFDNRYYPDGDGNTAPDKFDDIAVALEMAWEAFVFTDGMGYVSPLSVFNYTHVFVLIDNDERYLDESLFGYASVSKEDDDSWAFPYIILNGDYLYQTQDEQDEAEWDEETETAYYEAMLSTAVHEFFHIIQFTYVPEFVYTYYDVNFAEGSADWITDQVFPDHETYQETLSYYLDYPDYSLFGTESPNNNSYFKYGTAIWAKFLAENYGTDVIKEIFEDYFALAIEEDDWYYTILTATDRALNGERSDLIEAYNEFTVWNYDMSRYEESENYPAVAINETVSSFPFDRETSTIDEYYTRPHLFGSNYVVLETEGQGDTLTVTFEGHEDAKWTVTFLKDDEGVIEELDQTTIFAGEGEQTFEIEGAGDYEKIVMIVSVVDSNDAYDFAVDNGYSYTYYASFSGEAASTDVSFTSSYGDEEEEEDTEGFPDVPATHDNYRAILYLQANNVIDGYPDGTFQPEKTLNRAELTKLLVTGQGLSPDPNTYKNCFPDVAEEWFAVYVCYAKEKGWVGGYPDGTFLPGNTVNKVEALKILLESQGMDLPEDVDSLPFSDTDLAGWYAPYVDVAYRLGLLEEASGTFDPAGGMDRGGVSENLYRLLQVVRLELGDYNDSGKFDPMDYFPTTEGASWTYRNPEDDSTSTLTNSACDDRDDCLIQEKTDARAYYDLENDDIRLYQEMMDYGSVEYSPALVTLGTQNVSSYHQMEGTIDIEALGFRYTFSDGAYQFEILDEGVSVETEAGTFEALQVKQTFLMNAQFTFYGDGEEQTYDATIISEYVNYYAEEVGLVKQEMVTTYDVDDLPSLDGTSTEEVWGLVESTEGS